MSEPMTTFDDFWPFYVGEHRLPLNRLLHCAGTLISVLVILSAVVTMNLWLLLAAPLSGYGAAWIGHFGLEKNRPATFSHPLWSLRGDFKMCALMLTGAMDREVVRYYGSVHPAQAAEPHPAGGRVALVRRDDDPDRRVRGSPRRC